MVLLIDNYDSFTFNVYQLLATLTKQVEVVRNDAKTVAEILRLPITHLVISPGPGRPAAAGVSEEAVRALAGKVPVLGICLGHQAIGEVFGGKVVRAKSLMHGKSSEVTHDGAGVFRGLPSPLSVIRYHSLAVEESSLPPALVVTARSGDGEVMGIRHRSLTVEGVQFHPESFGTASGEALLANFLKLEGGVRRDP